ncbi:hypothetical protein ACQ859_15245 [Roseateles chitinivorans]|uniref:hypothetical protein n=1 Tax=Roseateles chitinivorans TaxID=2917965 RepID=UPI003D665340
MPNIPPLRTQLWFTSKLFDIEPDEDLLTNPRRYGKALANWLSSSLGRQGIEVAEVFPEDWGWCLMVKTTPFRLWIGCGNVDTRQSPDEPPPDGCDVVWTCIVVAEVPLLKRLFVPPDTSQAVDELFMHLTRIVAEAPSTEMVEEP